ncbi:hypothetical protein CEE37_05770 [candidate division LCP-89 bacterium B3_LCP]|uniref:HTH cro/C1-type domain-containing protein n=1 Tax=candidate division LCP-89 bacterium B3_LCP TaxID=2012998 RepID=A0A532V217_UNCL8|nr:MAG: hypothetical protein CEE37_05770 [candidate division LCP-89 bacterium B3_LCP]
MSGKIIRNARLDQGIQSSELAKLVGVSPATISLLESGRTDVGPKTLKRIADVLRLDYEALLAVSGMIPPGLRDLMRNEPIFSKLIHRLTLCQIRGYLSDDHLVGISRLLPKV